MCVRKVRSHAPHVISMCHYHYCCTLFTQGQARTVISGMAQKRFYNDHFLYADPLASSSTSQATRNRLSRKRKEEVNEQNNSTSIDNRGVDPVASVGTPPCENPDGCMVFQADIVDVDPVTSSGIPPCENINTYMYMELQAIFPDGEYYDKELDWISDDGENDDMVRPDQDAVGMQRETVALNDPLFPGCPLTVASSNVLIMQLKMWHNLTQEALADLLQFIALHFPSPNHCFPSVHLFNKQFDMLKHPVNFHCFCGACQKGW